MQPSVQIDISKEVDAAIIRYISYDWDWKTITKMINRTFGTTYLTAQLRDVYEPELPSASRHNLG